MKVLLYGECGDYGSGAWCYAETARQMGWEVSWFHPYTGVEKYLHSFQWKVVRKLNRRQITQRHLRLHNGLLLQQASQFHPDIVIILKGLFVTRDTVMQLKAAGAWVVNINHDDFFSLNPNNVSREQQDAIPHYDHIFTTREVNVDELKPRNPNTTFFPFAWYPGIHRVMELDAAARKPWECDVLFVGTWERERAALLEQVVQQVPARYAIYGSQWHKVRSDSPLQPYLKHKELRGDDMAHAIRYARMSLGFLRKENRDDYTQRTFEIPACGGLLLAERTPRHLRFYEEKKEAVFFDAGNAAELASQIQWLLAHPDTCEQIRQAGRARLLAAGHTYTDRLLHLKNVYDNRK